MFIKGIADVKKRSRRGIEEEKKKGSRRKKKTVAPQETDSPAGYNLRRKSQAPKERLEEEVGESVKKDFLIACGVQKVFGLRLRGKT